MWPALEQLATVLVADNYLYLPLWFDPEVAAITAVESCPPFTTVPTAGEPPILLRYHEETFIRTVYLPAVAAAAPWLFPAGQVPAPPLPDSLPDLTSWIPAKLEVLVYEVLPHFVRRRSSRHPEGDGRQALRQWLLRHLTDLTPGERLATRWREAVAVWETRLQELEKQGRAPATLRNGSYSGSQIRAWLQEGARAAAYQSAAEEVEAALSRTKTLLSRDREELLLLLTLSQRDQVEFNGFGWQRLPQPGEYLVYKRTGPYLLVDYFRRPYLFPDCRVAVPTLGPFKPIVLERYKHPLLRSHRRHQLICLPEDYRPAAEFSARAIINALEAGINALYYGYNPRQRNGYHSLDRYGRNFSTIDFEDLRLPPDHPLVQGGNLEIKNCYW